MENEKQNELMLGEMFVIKRQIENKDFFEIVEVICVKDYLLIKYKNLYSKEDEMMYYDFLASKRNLWFSEDFYVKTGLKLCDENILGNLKSNYCYYNLFKSWDEKEYYEENDKYYIVSILKKDNKEMQKHFKIKKEEFSNLQDLLIRDSYETYSSMDDFFKILGSGYNKVDVLKSLDQESLKIQFNPIDNQPKYMWSK